MDHVKHVCNTCMFIDCKCEYKTDSSINDFCRWWAVSLKVFKEYIAEYEKEHGKIAQDGVCYNCKLRKIEDEAGF